MKRVICVKTSVLLPLVLLSAALSAPAYANWFSDPDTGIRRHLSTAPSPSPQQLRGVRHYPTLSQSLAEQGTVGLRISLTEQGTVDDAVVVRSSGFPRLDNAAVRYAKMDWRYDRDDDQQMPKVVHTDVTFELKAF